MSAAEQWWVFAILAVIAASPTIALVIYDNSKRGKRARWKRKADRDAAWMTNAEKWNRTT